MSNHHFADNAVSRTVARQMKTLRTARAWSAVELADRITVWGYPITTVTVRFIESGRRRVVTVDELVALGAVFGVPLDDLLDNSCSACEGNPPVGYTCNSCGRPGATS